MDLTRLDSIVQGAVKKQQQQIEWLQAEIASNARQSLELLNMDQTHFYYLNAAVFHYGGGAGSGHYVMYLKTEEQWWFINDDRVQMVRFVLHSIWVIKTYCSILLT